MWLLNFTLHNENNIKPRRFDLSQRPWSVANLRIKMHRDISRLCGTLWNLLRWHAYRITCVKSRCLAVNGLPYSAFPSNSVSRCFHPCILRPLFWLCNMKLSSYIEFQPNESICWNTVYCIQTADCKSASGSRCQHHCISVRKTSRCSCAIGFTLNDDRRSCDTGQYI